MFSDTEIGMKLGFDRTVRAVTAQAQEVIDQQHAELVRLRRQVASAQRQSSDLILERGRARNEEIARRIAARN